MPKCTINGVDVEVKEGATIIEAMMQNKQKIAHYCWHPGLSVAGVCRLCMVEIEGNPRLQIACNTTVTEGMKINNTSDKVKDAAKWGLDFHLINHPLDCPICDQAGECGLQDQYMEFGKYNPEMAEHKVKKNKVVDLGPTVVLDSERCILCSRCVRFTDEVSKTNELGIFNRGDRSEIGTVEGKKLDNKYSLNTVDICPVGALTSKDFRFRQRVWYLKDSESVCNGCSTGCNIKVYFNKEGLFRVKPVYNESINGHWMCDDGRDLYKFANTNFRYTKALKKTAGSWIEMTAGGACREASDLVKNTASKTAVIFTGQYTNEEYDLAITNLKSIGVNQFYHWQNNPGKENDFDGLLIRGDKNPNTTGLKTILSKNAITSNWDQLISAVSANSIEAVIVAGPENLKFYQDISAKVTVLQKVKSVIWLQTAKSDELMHLPNGSYIIPMKSFVEKDGTFTNHSGVEQKFKKVTNIISDALTLDEAATLLCGKNITIRRDHGVMNDLHKRSDQVTFETVKKNEFNYKRGSL
jgi:NADH-quinone oxidoreductase subunit G